jgi:hypothetical protein
LHSGKIPIIIRAVTQTNTLISPLLSRIDDYCARSGRKEGGLSDHLFGDGKRIGALRNGADVGTRTLLRAHERLDRLFEDLDADAAMRAAAEQGGEVVHPGNMTADGPECDRNGAAQLRRVEGAA